MLPLPKTYLCHRAANPLKLDGRLTDPAWNIAPWTDDFADIEGAGKPAPRFRTRAKMLWDDDCFYVGAELEEPHVWATLTEHDCVIFHDNDFEVFIDPDGDSQFYSELEINALNTTWDLLLTRPYRAKGIPIDSWDIKGLRTAVHIMGTLNDPSDVDSGWSLEIAIPWRSMTEIGGDQCPPSEGTQWRVNFSRVEWEHSLLDGKYRKVPGRAEDNWVWSPQGVIDMHRPERWGVVQFTSLPPGGAHPISLKDEPDRRRLASVFDAQFEFAQTHGHWAGTLADLHLEAAGIELVTTFSGYEARLRDWHIDHTARLWRKE